MVTMIYVAWLADFLHRHGVASADLLAGTGIAADDLADPAAIIEDTQHIALLRNARKHCALAELGFEIGTHRHVSTMDRYGFALLCCESFAESLRVGCELQAAVGRFFNRGLRVAFFVDGDSGVLRIEGALELSDLHLLVVESVLGHILSSTRWVTGHDLPTRELRCAYPRPAHASVYLRYLDCAVCFEAANTELRFDAGFIARQLPFANRIAATMYRNHCRTLIGNVAPDALVERIRARILAGRGRTVPLEECASGLGLSTRTLRRHLHARGLSYQAIIDNMRAELACRELRATRRSIEAVACDLGFSEPTSFTRAFKRWTGMSPRAFRVASGGL